MFAFEIIQLFSLVFCKVRAVHKFYLRLVTTTPPPPQKKTTSRSDIWQDLYAPHPPTPVAVTSGKGLYPRCVGQMHFPVQKTCVAYSAAHSHCGTRQQLPPIHYFLFRPITKTTSHLRMTQIIKTADQLTADKPHETYHTSVRGCCNCRHLIT